MQNHHFQTDWVLFLDADEEVTPEFVSAAANAIRNSECTGFWIRYHNFFLGKELRFGVPQRKLALFRIGKGAYERVEEDNWSDLDMEVHEHPIVSGVLGEIRAPILHHSFKTVHDFVARHNAYSDWEARRYLSLRDASRTNLTARQRWKYSFLQSGWFPFVYFFFTYFVRAGILDGRAGFYYAVLKFAYFFQVALKIRERQMTLRDG